MSRLLLGLFYVVVAFVLALTPDTGTSWAPVVVAASGGVLLGQWLGQ